MSTIKIRGLIKRVLFQGENKVGLVVKDHNGVTEYKVLGPSMMDVAEGKRIEADCTLKKDAKWGDQYLADLIIEDVPKNTEGILSYLSYHAERIGPTTISKIRDHFKEKAGSILLESPDRLIEAGLSEKQVQSIKKTLEGSSVFKDLWAILNPFGVGPSVIGKIYDSHGADAITVVKTRPYSLCDIRGIGFKIADSIAEANGITGDNEARLSAATSYAMSEIVAQRGDTAIDRTDLIDEVKKLTSRPKNSVESEAINKAIGSLVSEGTLAIRKIDSKEFISTGSHAYKERMIAKYLKDLLDASVPDPQAAEHAVGLLREVTPSDRELDPYQKQALEDAFKHNVIIITGGPGCGKTTISQCIVKTAAKSGKVPLLSAPTGKAAQRMSEVTGMSADTMHGSLKPQGGELSEDGGLSFEFNCHNKLNVEVINLDEVSMADTNIFYDFISSIRPGTRLIMIGDFNQIPSVGPGMILRDLIKSRTIPTVQLKNVQRTAKGNDIPIVADMIIKGQSRKIDFDSTRNVSFIEASDESLATAQLKTAYAQAIKEYGINEVQVMTPRRGTALGVAELNEQLREISNPLKRNMKVLKTSRLTYRLGDRVIRNSPDRENDVANGEIGQIIDIDEKNQTAKVQFRKTAVYSKEVMGSEVDLANAITMHKSQGSEYKKVFLVVASSHVYMLNRNLIFTALTRGKVDSVIVGSKSAFHMGVAKLGVNRTTGLKHELLQVMKPVYGILDDPDDQEQKTPSADAADVRDPLRDTFIKRRRKIA